MAGTAPYFLLPGTAQEALTQYGDVFGCDVVLNTFEQFGRTDGPSDAIAHGYLEHGPVVDDLQQRPWGDWDGQVVDRFGVHWLIGFQSRP